MFRRADGGAPVPMGAGAPPPSPAWPGPWLRCAGGCGAPADEVYGAYIYRPGRIANPSAAGPYAVA